VLRVVSGMPLSFNKSAIVLTSSYEKMKKYLESIPVRDFKKSALLYNHNFMLLLQSNFTFDEGIRVIKMPKCD
jgi:hypothetical protein